LGNNNDLLCQSDWLLANRIHFLGKNIDFLGKAIAHLGNRIDLLVERFGNFSLLVVAIIISKF